MLGRSPMSEAGREQREVTERAKVLAMCGQRPAEAASGATREKGRPTVRVGVTQLTESVQLFDMPESEQLRAELAELKPVLAEEYPIAELGIFGSYARGEQHADSDLDVLVTFEEPVTLFDLVRLENELTDRLGVDVDLVTGESLRPRIGARVADDVRYV